MEIHYVVGDATLPVGTGTKVICHCVNDAGQWGSGFVLALNARWRDPMMAYREWFKQGTMSGVEFVLGNVQYVKVNDGTWVANLIGQHRTIALAEKVPIRYDAIKTGLTNVASFCIDNDASVHMPRMGAGLARGDWNEVERIVSEVLVDRGVSVTVYDLK